MSIKIMSLIWSDHSGTLSPTDKAILLRLADFAADDGSSVYPAVTRIFKDTGYSRRTVLYTLKRCVGLKVLSVAKRANKAKHLSTVYKINVQMLEKLCKVEKEVSKIKRYVINRKHVDNSHPSATDAPGASATDAPGASATDAPHPSLITTINNHHVVEDELPVDNLDRLAYFEWIEESGFAIPHRLKKEYRDLKKKKLKEAS